MDMTEKEKNTKVRKSFIQEAKENIDYIPEPKKRVRNPDEVNSTIRMSYDLRSRLAEYCLKNKISMNKLIVTFLEKEISK
jgi:predicted HicB family RNase H-like nuclease